MSFDESSENNDGIDDYEQLSYGDANYVDIDLSDSCSNDNVDYDFHDDCLHNDRIAQANSNSHQNESCPTPHPDYWKNSFERNNTVFCFCFSEHLIRCNELLDILCNHVLPKKSSLHTCIFRLDKAHDGTLTIEREQEIFRQLKQLSRQLGCIPSFRKLSWLVSPKDARDVYNSRTQGAEVAFLLNHVKHLRHLSCPTFRTMCPELTILFQKQASFLEVLKINNGGESPDHTLFHTVLSLKKLCFFQLRDYSRTPGACIVPSQFFNKLLRLSSLRKLQLINCNLIEQTTSLLHGIGRESAQLQSLHIHECMLPFDFVEKFIEAIQRNRNLTSLSLMIKQKFLQETYGRKLGTALATHASLSTLEILLLDGSNHYQSQEEWVHLLKCLSTSETLHSLQLKNFTWISKGMCKALRGILRQSLSFLALEVSNNWMKSWQSVLPALRSASLSLKKLNLVFGNRFNATTNSNTHGRECVLTSDVLLSEILQLPSLTTISKLEHLRVSFFSSNSSYIPINSFLRSLDNNPLLKTLHISFGTVSGPGWEDVVETIKANVTLQHLSTGIRGLSNIIPSHPHLQIANGILSMNRAGRCYIIDDARNKVKFVKVIIAVTKNLDCIYIHLRENPFFCYRAYQHWSDKKLSIAERKGTKRKVCD